jgi:hypothetical protein
VLVLRQQVYFGKLQICLRYTLRYEKYAGARAVPWSELSAEERRSSPPPPSQQLPRTVQRLLALVPFVNARMLGSGITVLV